jgi:hypothetical protein
MREIRLSGSEGGGTEFNRFSLPLSAPAVNFFTASDARGTRWRRKWKILAKRTRNYGIAMQSLCISNSAVLYLKNIHMLLMPDWWA